MVVRKKQEAREPGNKAGHASPYFQALNHRLERSPFYPCYEHLEVALGVYNRRLYPWTLGHDPVEHYWHLRRQSALFDVPEKPLIIEGPDACALLNLIFTRDVEKMKIGRCGYGIACLPDGGILMDGMLMRLGPETFWYVQADGEFLNWLQAHAMSFDVEIRDPNSWVLQVQGPTSLEVLREASDSAPSEPFNYFDVAACQIAGHDVYVSRTGWTGEIGFEIYTKDDEVDGPAIWNQLLAKGAPYGLIASGLESMGTRRIEAGIMDYGTDLGTDLTPIQAGLGAFVDMSKSDFIGMDAIAKADQGQQLHGFKCAHGAPVRGSPVEQQGRIIGSVTSAAWSPKLECGIGFWRSLEPSFDKSEVIAVSSLDGSLLTAQYSEFPFYDKKKAIPRGLITLD